MTSPLARIAPVPDLVEQVHGALLEAISSGALAPGERLGQEDIAQQLAVSRQPVLQALRLLKNAGLVRDAPGRGLEVAPLDVALLAAVYQVRAVLDGLAARLAAERQHQLDPALLTAGRAAARSGNVAAMIEADLAFHQAVYAASGNPLIGASAALHWQHIRRAMGVVLQRSALRESVWDEHTAIADAIAQGNAIDAEILMASHGDHAGAHMQRQLTAAVPLRAEP